MKGLSKFLFRTKIITLYLFPILFLTGCLWLGYLGIKNMQNIKLSPQPLPIEETDRSVEKSSNSSITPIVIYVAASSVLIVGVILFTTRLMVTDQDRSIIRRELNAQLLEGKYMGSFNTPFIIGILFGCYWFAKVSMTVGESVDLNPSGLFLPIILGVYIIYLDWSWSITTWFIDKDEKGESPSDILTTSGGGGILIIHAIMVISAIIAAIVAIIYRQNILQKISAIYDPQGIFSIEQLYIMTSTIVLGGVLVVIPCAASILVIGSLIKFWNEKKKVSYVKHQWYYLTATEKLRLLKQNVLPMLDIYKSPVLQNYALDILNIYGWKILMIQL